MTLPEVSTKQLRIKKKKKILYKCFQRREKERTLPNMFYKRSTTLMSKLDENIKRKSTDQYHMQKKKDAKVLKKISANKIWQYIKKIVGFIMIKLGLFLEYNNSFSLEKKYK